MKTPTLRVDAAAEIEKSIELPCRCLRRVQYRSPPPPPPPLLLLLLVVVDIPTKLNVELALILTVVFSPPLSMLLCPFEIELMLFGLYWKHWIV